MRILRIGLAAALLCAAAPGWPQNATGVHDFDFLVGDWHVHHRVMRPASGGQWIEFDGTCTLRLLMGGSANVEDHTFTRPTGVTRAVGVRAYDAQSNEWAIWWIDSRAPHSPMDPPMKGRFDHASGVGTFYSDGTLDGKPTRTRFIWSQITATSARWEQALSHDAGKTWETNWVMEWRRVSATPH